MLQNKLQSPLLNRMLVRVGGGVAAAFGCTALLGWLLELPFLASLGQGLIPMAPSTAMFFIVYGILLLTAQRLTRNRRAMQLIMSTFACGLIIATALFILSIKGVFLDIEHFGIKAMGAVDGTPVGHMSPITAFTFMLLSLLCPLVISAPDESARRAKTAWWSAVLLVASYVMLLLAYLLGTPMFYGGAFIPPAATTSLAFVALCIALAALSRPLAWPGSNSFEKDGGSSFRTLAVLFVFLAAGIISAGYYYQRQHENQYLAEVERQLSVIADLKMSELRLWREERLWDASMFYNNAPFAALVREYLRNPGAKQAGLEIGNWVDHTGKSRDYYRIFLLDANGTVRLSFPEQATGPLSSHVKAQGSESMHSGRIKFVDFYRDEFDGKIYLCILVPVLAPEDKTPLAVLAMRIDPEKYLYPFLKSWPSISASAETLLVRREGNEVLFLNELRFNKDAALKLRIPIDRQEVPSVKSVMGQKGVVRGSDYRGNPVVAALRTVPDSPWHLISKMDVEEVYAPLRERLWITVVLVCALLFSAGTGVGFIWRQQRTSHLKHYLDQTRRNEERLQGLLNVFQHDAKDVKALLDFVLAEALSMTASRYGYICYYEAEKNQLVLKSWSPEAILAGEVLNPQSMNAFDKTGLWGESIAERKPVMVNDFKSPDLLEKGHPPPDRFLTIPLVDQGRIVAIAGVANKESAYDDTDVLQLTLLMGSVRKIAERMKADLALAEREGRLKRAEELAHLGHWRYDLRTGRVAWSDEMYRIFGLRRKAERTSLKVAEITGYCHPEDLKNCAGSFDPAAQEEDGRGIEYRIIRPSGEERYVVSNGETERDEHDEVVALFGTLQDTTELKKKERELEQKNAEMERFTYTVSHDLKSPLVTVKSFVGFLEKDMAAADSGRIAKDLLYMRTATDRMSMLLDQLLVMSRVGKVITPPVQVHFSDLVQEAMGLVEGSIRERGVLMKQVQGEQLTLYGERTRFVEIWQNLIENAVKYMGGQPEPRIEIGFEITNSVPVFFVADNGIGIDPRYHAKIFSLFDKLDPNSEGTGLGLALVKRIVEMYEGNIWVESAGVGEGSCFRFTLPLATIRQRDETVDDE